MKTFKVTIFIWENIKETKLRVRKYITVKGGMTWQEAKDMRRIISGSFIVRERSV